MEGDLMMHLEELRDRGGRRLTGVETIRAARSLNLKLELLAGTCSAEGTSQAGRIYHSPDAVWSAVFDGVHVNLCAGCARYHLHGIAAFARAVR